MATEQSSGKDKVRLDRFQNRQFDRGVPAWKESIWLFVQALFISSWLPGNVHRVYLLRLFGAHIGQGVILKPHIRIKFPWRLKIGDYSWIGESCWIDNLAEVTIGDHCCLSQGSCLCTGNHDWSVERFDLLTYPIVVGNYSWIAAFAKVGPGVNIGEGAVLSFASVATKNLESWKIYAGIPCHPVRDRYIRSQEKQSLTH